MANRDEAVDLAVNNEKRLRMCQIEMDAVLKKWGCKLSAAVLVAAPNHIESMIKVVLDPSVIIAPGE